MNLQAIADSQAVREARSLIRRRERETLEEQIGIAEIPAPTGLESARAAYVAERFAEIGLVDRSVDNVGNVFGWLPSSGDSAASRGQPVLLTTHLDTIFPQGTAITARKEGTRVFAPGITDNSRGIAATLAIAETLQTIGIRTDHPIVFVATVGEEGLGDLRGVKHLFRTGSPHRSAAAFLAIDGAGVSRIIHRAVGASRLRVTITGPGGHSWGDRGSPNPAHALADTISRLSGLTPPNDAAFAVNVGRLGGGTSINAIPAEAWCELDLRNESAESLEWMEAEAKSMIDAAVSAASGGTGDQPPLECRVDRIGSRPCGVTPAESALVQAAIGATRFVGKVPALATSSTDANVPMSLGIPAIALGAGGRGGGIHTLDEWFDNVDGARGIERALLTLLAISGIQFSDQDG
jgi:acetylornithine deacetylase/succinyl-diaminopimelate desuccinylase-like protein